MFLDWYDFDFCGYQSEQPALFVDRPLVAVPLRGVDSAQAPDPAGESALDGPAALPSLDAEEVSPLVAGFGTVGTDRDGAHRYLIRMGKWV